MKSKYITLEENTVFWLLENFQIKLKIKGRRFLINKK